MVDSWERVCKYGEIIGNAIQSIRPFSCDISQLSLQVNFNVGTLPCLEENIKTCTSCASGYGKSHLGSRLHPNPESLLIWLVILHTQGVDLLSPVLSVGGIDRTLKNHIFYHATRSMLCWISKSSEISLHSFTRDTRITVVLELGSALSSNKGSLPD